MNTASPTKKEPDDESERAVSKGAGAADVLLCYAPDCEQDRQRLAVSSAKARAKRFTESTVSPKVAAKSAGRNSG